jgi:hypothetical protein
MPKKIIHDYTELMAKAEGAVEKLSTSKSK